MRAVAFILALGCLHGCTYPATDVRVDLDTDAPSSRVLTIRATVATGNEVPTTSSTAFWTRGGVVPGITLPGSFGVTPPHGGSRSAVVTLTVDADLAAGSAGEPERAWRRIARFAFTPNATTHVPIFLAVACANQATGCTSVPASSCTVSVFCADHGQTCGDDGTCTSPNVTPLLLDAATPAPDATTPDIVAADVPEEDTATAVDTGPCGAQTLCGATCIDTMNDRTHCGDCTFSCVPFNLDCQAGHCYSTPQGNDRCDTAGLVGSEGTIMGTTCGADDTVNTLCGTPGTPDVFFRLTTTATIIGVHAYVSPGFLIQIYPEGLCTVGTPMCMAGLLATPTGAPPGNYWIVVERSAGGCGAYTLTLAPDF